MFGIYFRINIIMSIKTMVKNVIIIHIKKYIYIIKLASKHIRFIFPSLLVSEFIYFTLNLECILKDEGYDVDLMNPNIIIILYKSYIILNTDNRYY